MKSVLVCSIILSLFAFVAIPASGQEKAKGAKGDPATQIVNQFLKQLEKAELNEEQTSKIKEVMTKAAKEAVAKRTEAGITKEVMKKRADATKAAKDSGKKVKELAAEVDAASGFTDEQKKEFAAAESIMSKARIEVGQMLTTDHWQSCQKTFKPI